MRGIEVSGCRAVRTAAATASLVTSGPVVRTLTVTVRRVADAVADPGFRLAVARSCAGHATTVVVRNAHQVHGAIGTTSEHRLHEFTRAALAWRSEYGSVRYWDEVLTGMAVQAGANGLWGLICP